MSDRIFKTQKEVLDFLHESGLKISCAKLSKDYRAGILRCQPDKTFLENDVATYANSLIAPEYSQAKITDNAQASQIRHLKAMILALFGAVPNLTALDNLLSKWQERKDIDPKVMEKLEQCHRRVKRNMVKKPEAASSSSQDSEKQNSYEYEYVDVSTPDIKQVNEMAARPYLHDIHDINCAEPDNLSIRYRNRLHVLNPDQIKLPDIPGGYDREDNFNPHARFCLTGIFAYGERGDCEKLVKRLGGKVAKIPVLYEQCYINVGTLASLGWSETFYGNKIRMGVEYRLKGAPVKILSEDDWIKLVMEYDKKDE